MIDKAKGINSILTFQNQTNRQTNKQTNIAKKPKIIRQTNKMQNKQTNKQKRYG